MGMYATQILSLQMETVMRASQQRLGIQHALSAIRAQIRDVDYRLAAVQRNQRQIAAKLEAGGNDNSAKR